jgi:hypothetical protein
MSIWACASYAASAYFVGSGPKYGLGSGNSPRYVACGDISGGWSPATAADDPPISTRYAWVSSAHSCSERIMSVVAPTNSMK